MMSILLRGPDGALTLWSKGADDKMLARLAPECADERRMLEEHLGTFAAMGLRTLVLGNRAIPMEEYAAWRPSVDAALTQTGDQREEALNRAYDMLEARLRLVGATAIEDKLQDGVPETIAALRTAGVSFWMLTGDKFETARQIARSCCLWSPGEELHALRSSCADVAGELRAIAAALPPRTAQPVGTPSSERRSSLRRRLLTADAMDEGGVELQQKGGHCLIVEGSALERVLANADAQRDLLDAGLRCASVVCCRVTPGQKAKVTRLVKGSDEPLPPALSAERLLWGRRERRVLGIGDGGNDVAMIQEATVWVGIVGKEGKQASRAADYAVPMFRCLRPLLLVHGHWSYARSAYITQYCFYKSMLIAWAQMVWNCVAGFSGVSFWNSMLLTFWNGAYTLPGPFFYVLDRTAPRMSLFSNPQLYAECREGSYLTPGTFALFILRGQVQGTAAMLATIWAFGGSYAQASDGDPMPFTAICTVTYTAMLIAQSWTLVLESSTLMHLNLLNIVLMPFCYVATQAVYSSFPMFEYYGVVPRLWGDPVAWLLVLLQVVLLMVPHNARLAWQANYAPGPTQEERLSAASRGSPSSAMLERQRLWAGGTDLLGPPSVSPTQQQRHSATPSNCTPRPDSPSTQLQTPLL